MDAAILQMGARASVNIFQQMDIYKTLKGYSAMYLTESITTRPSRRKICWFLRLSCKILCLLLGHYWLIFYMEDPTFFSEKYLL